MPQRAVEPACLVILLTGCVIGGSNEPGRLLLNIPQLLSLPLLVLVLLAERKGGTAVWIAATILVLPLVQLVPLPPSVWTTLPGRIPVAEAYAAAGIALPWLPISLTPGATENLWLGLLPAVTLFLAVPRLAIDAQRRLIYAAILLGVVDVALGFAQLAGGPTSPLRLYASASRTDAVGYFANRNHQATFLAMLVPLAGSLAVGRSRGFAERLWLAGLGIFLLLGIAASGSRAGLVLGLAAGVAAVWTLIASQPVDRKMRRLLGSGLAGLIGLFGVAAVVLRPDVNALAGDLRWQIVRTTWDAIARVFPVGAGFGSFERYYAQFERSQDLIAAIINNAHNDWLEVTLEGGLPALLLLLAGLAYLLRETFFRPADANRSTFHRAVLRATLAALWLCALHSTLDYPLRTMAVNLVLALACGLRVAARSAATMPAHAPRSGESSTTERRSPAPRARGREATRGA